MWGGLFFKPFLILNLSLQWNLGQNSYWSAQYDRPMGACPPWWPRSVQIEISLDGARCHNKKNPREGDTFSVLTIFMAFMLWNVWNLMNAFMIRFISCKNFTKTLNLYQLSLPQISLSMEFGAKLLLVNQYCADQWECCPKFHCRERLRIQEQI